MPSSNVRRPGFSLIELALALSILLIVIPTMLPVYENFVGDVQEQALRQRVQELRRALQVFYLEHGAYPNQLFDQFGNNVDFLDDRLSELVNGTHNGFGIRPPSPRTYLPAIPEDPLLGQKLWTLVPMDNDGDGVFNEDPVEVTTGTYLAVGKTRGLTESSLWRPDFIKYDNDADGQFDEDPIDVGDVRSKTPGYEQL